MSDADFSYFNSLIESIQNLDLSIPSEIFLALSSLTNFVGYIMPLRLYIPIITLILSYWFLMIAINAGKGLLSFIGTLGTFFAKFSK